MIRMSDTIAQIMATERAHGRRAGISDKVRVENAAP
jgi:hypothetical protein